MKKHAKRAISLLLTGMLLVGSISGCTSNKTSDTSNTSGTGSPTDSASNTATGGDSSYPITPEELGSGTVKWAENKTPDGWMEVTNEGGTTLGYSPDSGVKLIQVEGFAFKDLNRDGKLDAYEDWRLDTQARATDLAGKLTVEDVAGLMLYSAHQRNVTKEVNDEQKTFLDAGLRAVLSAATADPTDVQAAWANAMQAYVEGKGLGIPVCFSTDPRSSGVSVWPGNLALAATFDPSIALEQGKQLGKEYRALGLGTLLGPQIDLATEPRWARVSGTFGEDPALSRDLTEAASSGYQSTYDASGNDIGWGSDSVNAMIKHWPGDGPGESGREAHFAWGQFAVYPGGQYNTHLIPFVDGGLKLSSKTEKATSVMSSYSIAWSDSEEYGELVGSAFSKQKLDLLRSYGFDGVICSDWAVIGAMDVGPTKMDTGWGVQELSQGERCYKALMAGIDQFGGLNDRTPVMEAYELGKSELGEEAILARFQESGSRLVRNYFNVGLFDNPYVSVDNAKKVVGSAEAVAAGLAAQQKSIVMLKNDGNVIKAENASAEKPTVYIPMVYTDSVRSFFGASDPTWTLPVDLAAASDSINIVTDKLADPLTGTPNAEGKPTASYKDIIRATKEELAQCDYALVMVKSPNNGSYFGGFDQDTSTYLPLSLQYGAYTANSEFVRKESLAGLMVEKEVETVYGKQKTKEKENRSYFGKSAKLANGSDLDTIFYAVDNMPESAKIVVAVNASNPLVFSEFESKADAILMGFGVDNRLFIDALLGKFEPTGLLPLQMPKDMNTVEKQQEDVPRDMECYVDTAGNTYDFAYGLNWAGVIKDARTEKYNVAPLTAPTNQPK